MAGKLKLGDLREIFDDIMRGDSLRAATGPQKKGRPLVGRVLYAIQTDPVCFEHYARARERRADVLAEEIIEIADTEPDPHRARVRVDARKWYAGKVNKTYADRQEVTLRTADMTDEQIESRIDELLKNRASKK